MLKGVGDCFQHWRSPRRTQGKNAKLCPTFQGSVVQGVLEHVTVIPGCLWEDPKQGKGMGPAGWGNQEAWNGRWKIMKS